MPGSLHHGERLTSFEELTRPYRVPDGSFSALASITAPKIVQVETVTVVPEVVTLPGPPEEKLVAKSKLRHVEREHTLGQPKN